MPKITVIVPVYRVEPYLRRCVDSILGQSYEDFELVLVDDGSPDACPCICDDYEDQDPRVHVIHRKNGGLSAARNTGIQWALRCSDSQWLTFIDSDDWVHRDYLRILMEGTKWDVNISACGFRRVPETVEDAVLPALEARYMDAQQAYVEEYGLFMTACCKLVRKALYETLRFPQGKLHEDCYITHCLLFDAGRVSVTDAELYYYYFNPASITRSQWKPRRLDEIEAHEQRLTYFQVRGYAEAYRRELEVYIQTLYEHTSALGVLEDRSLRPYLSALLRKQRKAVKLGRSLGLYPRNRENFWLHLMNGAGPRIWLLGQKVNGVLRDRRKG